MQTYKDVVATFKEKNPKKDGTWKYDPELGFYRQGGRVGYKPGGIVEPGVTHYATEYLSNEEFSSLYKKFKGTDKEFADSLNKKGYKAKADRKFTADSVFTRRKRLELESKGYVRPTIKDFKKEAKALGIDIKGLDDQTIKNKVRDKRGDLVKQKKRLTDPDFAAKERAIQKAWQEANPEKVKEVRFQSRVRAYEKTGMIQPVKNAKEELWRSLFEDGKRYTEGRRLKIQGDYGRYVPRERFLNAKILDTKTGKTITFKNLENYINPKNTGKTYDQVIKPYNQKWFINDTPGLRTEINSKLIPNWTKADKRNFFEIQHNAGRYNDPFDVSLSNRSVNLKESQVRTKFEKMWNASDNLSDKKKAFKFYNDNLPKEILSKPSIVERPRYFGEEVPLDKQLRTLKKESGVNLPRGTLKKAELLLQQFCGYGKSAGGRIGFNKGSCSPEVAQRNFLMATDDVAKGRVTGKAAEQITKNAGKIVAKAGSKSALMSILGPAGLGLDIAFEIGSIGTDMAMDSNVTLKGALQNNWLTGFFMKGTGQEEYHKGLFARDSSAKPFGTAMDLYARIEEEERALKRMKTGSDRATTTEAMLNAQKQKIADLSSFFDKLARKEGGRYLALEEGSPEQVAYERAKQEHDSIGAAKALLKRTSKAGFEKMIKEGAQNKMRGYSKYGYEEPEQYGDFTKNELDTILKKFAPDNPNVNPETYGFKDYSDLSTFISNFGKTQNVAEAGGVANMAAGGRIGFKLGGFDKGRRAFMKWLAGITGATIAGGTGLIKLSKGAKTVAPQVTEEVIKRSADGMPTYIADLIKVVKAKGVKKIVDSNINKYPDTVHSYKGVEVIDEVGGTTRIKRSTEGVATDSSTGKMNEGISKEVEMEIKPSNEVFTDPESGMSWYIDEGKGTRVYETKPPDEYMEGTVRPDNEGKMKDFEEGIDDVDHLELKKIADEGTYDTSLPDIDDID